MDKANELNVEAGFDRSLIWQRGNSVRYLVVTATAPEARPDPATVRPPLNLALVIDASGSMQGAPLEAARQAALGIAESLRDADTLSVVSFDSASTVHLRACPMTPKNKDQARAILAGIQAGSMTNLSAGWLDGAECVAEHLERQPGCVSRVLLLSDGHANEGITSPPELAQIAEELRDRGVFTSTVGIGDGYSTDQIQTIAEHGGGMLHDAERPEEIIEVVLGELHEVLHLWAEDVELRVTHDPRVRVSLLGDQPFHPAEGACTCRLGALLSGRSRSVVLKVTCPAGEAGRRLLFDLTLRWRAPGQGEFRVASDQTLVLTMAGGRENGQQPRDGARSLLAARQWQAHVMARAIRMNREGRYHEVQEYLLRQLRYFRRYCEGLPGAEGLPEDLERAARVFVAPMMERTRKDMNQGLYQEAKNVSDYRSVRRASWSETLRRQDPHGSSDAAR